MAFRGVSRYVVVPVFSGPARWRESVSCNIAIFSALTNLSIFEQKSESARFIGERSFSTLILWKERSVVGSRERALLI